MEVNRFEEITRDGIQTTSQVARTVVQSGGEVAGELVSATSKFARDTAHTAEESSVALLTSLGRVLTAVRGASEQGIALWRSTTGGVIEMAGSLARGAVRVAGEVAIEVVHSVRGAASAILVARTDDEDLALLPRKQANGGSADYAA